MKDPRVLKQHLTALGNEYKHIIAQKHLEICCIDEEGEPNGNTPKESFTNEEVDAILDSLTVEVSGMLDVRLKLMEDRINEG